MKRINCIATLLGLFMAINSYGQGINYLELPKDRQFDFWVGTWDVNLRVQQPDKSWADQIKSEAKIYAINEGRAILELWNDQRPTGIKGFSLRYYDFDQDKWVLWLNWPGNNQSGMSSLTGEFRHGRGEFFGGKGDTLTRYSFSDITPHYLRWDDAFTFDGGKTWTHNWIMEFTRTEQKPSWPAGIKGHTYDQGGRCNLPGFDAFRNFVGDWKGQVKVKDGSTWKSADASLKGFEVLNGCAVLNFLDYEIDGKKSQEFSIKSFNTFINKLSDGRIGSGKTDVLARYFGEFSENSKQYNLIEFDPKKSLLQKYEWNMEAINSITVNVYQAAQSQNPDWKKIREFNLKKQ